MNELQYGIIMITGKQYLLGVAAKKATAVSYINYRQIEFHVVTKIYCDKSAGFSFPWQHHKK